MTKKLNALTKFGNEFDLFSRGIDDLFHFFGNSPFRNIENNLYIPPIDLIEQKDKYIINLEIPGTSKEEIEVTLTDDDTIILKGEKKQKKIEGDEVLLSETGYGSFRREIRINKNIDKERVEASYDKGILQIFLPKKEEEQPKITHVKIN